MTEDDGDNVEKYNFLFWVIGIPAVVLFICYVCICCDNDDVKDESDDEQQVQSNDNRRVPDEERDSDSEGQALQPTQAPTPQPRQVPTPQRTQASTPQYITVRVQRPPRVPRHSPVLSTISNRHETDGSSGSDPSQVREMLTVDQSEPARPSAPPVSIPMHRFPVSQHESEDPPSYYSLFPAN